MPVKAEESEVLCFDNAKAKQFYECLGSEPDIRIKTALMILLFMGLRRAELCGLEWRDIDLEGKKMTILRNSLPVPKHGVITKGPKTKTSKRTIFIPDSLVDALKEYKVVHTEDGVRRQVGGRGAVILPSRRQARQS